MAVSLVELFKSFSDELDPERLQEKFLKALLRVQNVDRGSIWIREPKGYRCVAAQGVESDRILGVLLPVFEKSIVGWVIEHGEMVVARPDEDPRHYRKLEAEFETKSSLILAFPLLLKDGSVYGAVEIIDTNPEHRRINLEKPFLEFVRELVNIGSVALGNALAFAREKKATEELRSAIDLLNNDPLLIGQSPSFRAAVERITGYAATDYPVCITGESGTGKELVARKIHELSHRKAKPFLAINCSAIPENLLESELFGYRKGAFSGASRDKKGLFEAASPGTLFLDEIGDMPLELQAKVLRVIQESEVQPLGSVATRKVDVRIVSATNRDLARLVEKGRFRRDLYYRLAVLPLELPPLRERKEDIPLLLNHFLRREAARNLAPPKRFDKQALATLMAYPWPGNIRELENLAKLLTVVCSSEEVTVEELPPEIRESGKEGALQDVLVKNGASPPTAGDEEPPGTWQEMERRYVQGLLGYCKGNVSWAAEVAGLPRSTFISRLRRLNVSPPPTSRRRRKTRSPGPR